MKEILLMTILSILVTNTQEQKKKAPADDVSTGKTIFEQHCMTCHQVDGSGAQNMIPPLIKTDYVLGNKTTLVKILLNGMRREIKVNGDTYENEMPSQASLTDKEIAAVLTYVRNSFGNKATPVNSSEVKKIRSSNNKIKPSN